MKINGKEVSYKDSLKSMDTEETIDLMFYRPIGFAWAVLFAKLGIKPNAVTIASIFLGVGAGVMFYFPNLWLNIIGMLLLIWANSYDSADGQLARLTQQYSRIGRILDGLSGDFWFVTIYVSICLRVGTTSEFFINNTWLIWTLAVVAGACHGIQATRLQWYAPTIAHCPGKETSGKSSPCSSMPTTRKIRKSAPRTCRRCAVS